MYQRKTMTMHKAFNPGDDFNIGDTVDASIQRLEDYIEKHEAGLTATIKNDTTMANSMIITRKQKWEENQLYGRFKQLINNISQQKTWTWQRKDTLKEKHNLSSFQDKTTP